MDSEIRNELFTLLREVNDAGTMKDSQLRDCIDELEEIIDRAVPEPDADAVERAAKAIFREVVDSDWEAVGKRVKDTYRGMARAALAALDAAKGKEDEQEDCGCTSIDYGWYGNDGGIVSVIQCSDEGCPRANKGAEGARDGAG